MTFFHILLILFCSPAYFLIRGKWLGFLFNSVLYLIAIGLVITVVLAPGGFIFWLLGAMHGSFSFRRDMLEHHATLTAQRMATAMQAAGAAQAPPAAPPPLTPPLPPAVPTTTA